MLGGCTIVTTSIISRIVFKRKILRHHCLAICFSMTGFVLVGLSSILGEKSSSGDSKSVGKVAVGIGMVGVSVMFSGCIMNFQEFLFRKYELPVQREIGIEGHFGIIWIFIEMIIFSYITCL